MCGYIVLLFVKELLTDNYLINFSVDVLVAIVAFYITLHNLINQYKLISEHGISKNHLCFNFWICNWIIYCNYYAKESF